MGPLPTQNPFSIAFGSEGGEVDNDDPQATCGRSFDMREPLDPAGYREVRGRDRPLGTRGNSAISCCETTAR